MQLNITGKIIDTRPLADLLVQGEKGTTTLTMVSARYYDGIDLGSLAWEIWGSYRSQDSTVTLAVDKSYDDEQITFSVTLNEYFACYPGAQDITLVGSDASDTQVLKLTGSHAIIIRDNERGTSSILIPSQVSNIEQAVRNCLDAANVASTAASEAAAASRAATEAAEQIETLRASIAAAQGTAENAQSTAQAAQEIAEGKVSKKGDTFIGDVTIDGKVLIVQNGDAYVRLFADAEGGNIRMQKSLNTYWEIDTQPAEALRFYRMANGVNTCAITMPNKSGKIALEMTRTSVSPAAVSVANSAGTAVASITLDPGMWLIIGRGMFAANSTGSRQLKLSESSGDTNNSVSAMTSLGASPGTLIAEVTWTFSNTSAKTIYLNAWQNSGGSLSIQGCIIALKYA